MTLVAESICTCTTDATEYCDSCQERNPDSIAYQQRLAAEMEEERREALVSRIASMSHAERTLRLAKQQRRYALISEGLVDSTPRSVELREQYAEQTLMLAELADDRRRDLIARDRTEAHMRFLIRTALRARPGGPNHPRPGKNTSPRYVKPERTWAFVTLDRTPFDAEIHDIVDRDENVASILDGLAVERVRVEAKRGPETGKTIPAITITRELPAMQALRRSLNGRRLLDLYRARAEWRDEHLDVRDEITGREPRPDAERDLELRLTMHDEEFRAVTAEPDAASVEDYERWEAQDVYRGWVEWDAYFELRAELDARNIPASSKRAVRLWIEKRLRTKSGNRLRAYRSCTYSLRHGFYTGFQYDGFDSDRFEAWRARQEQAVAA